MKIEIEVNGKGIIIATLKKIEDEKNIVFNEGFSTARRLYDLMEDKQ